jgi:hypothetical protein
MRRSYESQRQLQEGWSSLQSHARTPHDTHQELTRQTNSIGNLKTRTALRTVLKKSSNRIKLRKLGNWIIPARIATGNILWPHEDGKREAVAPHGVRHYYAPLAVVKFNHHGVLETLGDLRPKFRVPIEFGS